MAKQRFRRTVHRQDQTIAINDNHAIGGRIQNGFQLADALLLRFIRHRDRFRRCVGRFDQSVCKIGRHKHHHRGWQIAPWQGLEHHAHGDGVTMTRLDLQQGGGRSVSSACIQRLLRKDFMNGTGLVELVG